MSKYLSVAGMLLIAVLLCVQPSKADTFNTYEITGHGVTVTFTLPTTLTPSSVTWNGILNIQNVSGTFNGNSFSGFTIMIGNAGWGGFTNYWASGSQTRFFELESPGLFTWNADGTVTLKTGTLALGDYHIYTGGSHDYTLTIVDPPGDSVPTPEPASVLLLGVGGLALGAIRRCK
jgi:hypothetical protein